jgi:hypothetical protein
MLSIFQVIEAGFSRVGLTIQKYMLCYPLKHNSWSHVAFHTILVSVAARMLMPMADGPWRMANGRLPIKIISIL